MQAIAIGNQYGKLVVLGQGGVDERRNRLWLCLCECGQTTKINTSDLGNGRRRSCGCLHQEARKARRKRVSHTAALDCFLYPGRKIPT